MYGDNLQRANAAQVFTKQRTALKVLGDPANRLYQEFAVGHHPLIPASANVYAVFLNTDYGTLPHTAEKQRSDLEGRLIGTNLDHVSELQANLLIHSRSLHSTEVSLSGGAIRQGEPDGDLDSLPLTGAPKH